MGAAVLESSNSRVFCHHCCNYSRHRCHTRSAAVCQFAQHTAAAEMIPSAAASTDTALVYVVSRNGDSLKTVVNRDRL